MELSDGEKLIVALLCDLHRGEARARELDPDFIMSALVGGHFWALRWTYDGVLNAKPVPEEAAREVAKILDMWSFIESAHAKLSKKDTKRVRDEAGPLGGQTEFPGFDGNNESEYYSIARFFTTDMGRFTQFAGRDLNSHMPMLESYHRMLAVFDKKRPELATRTLTADDLIELHTAAIHPDNKR